MPIAGFCWMMQIPPSAAHLRGLSCSSYPFSTWEVSCHCIPLWIQHQPWQRGWITAEVPPGLGGWDLPWGHCKGSLTLARAPRVQSSASAWFPRLALPQVNPTDLRQPSKLTGLFWRPSTAKLELCQLFLLGIWVN